MNAHSFTNLEVVFGEVHSSSFVEEPCIELDKFDAVAALDTSLVNSGIDVLHSIISLLQCHTRPA